MLSFVILHYKNVDDTLDCLNSIKKLNNQDEISIVIVDNNTLNDNDYKILSSYTNDIIKLDSNLGFAKANNIGCKYAIEKYDPDFIYCINNDTIISQENTLELIEKLYKKYKFDVAGPKIITDCGESVNPFPVYNDVNTIKKVIDKNKKLIKLYSNFITSYLIELYLLIKYKFKKIEHLKNGDREIVGASLHGCAVLFSKKYLKKYEYPFYNETFLYHEEEFLTYRKNKDNLKFVYSPSLEIFHKEGASLNFNVKNNRKRKLFRYREINKSLNLLLDLYGGRDEG